MSLFRNESRAAVFSGGALFNPWERPSMPLASLALDGILGGHGTTGADPLDALGIPTAYRCVALIANVMAASILEDIDRTGKSSPWMAWQNLQSYTAYEITELLGVHMAGWGNFYAFKAMGSGPYDLVDLQPIFPGNVDVIRVRGRKIFKVKMPNEDGTPGTTIEDFTEDDIFHVPFLGYDGLKGCSPITWAQRTFGTAIGGDTLAARFMASGQQLGGVVKVKAPLANQGQADAIKTSWMNSHGGVGNAGTVAVLDAETDFQPITINPDNLQLIEGRTWQAQEVARMYGVPLTMLSFDSTGYGDAIDSQQAGFITYTIRQYTDRSQQRLAREFQPRGRSLRFNVDNVLRPSTLERYQAYTEAINAGWFLREEARTAEGMDPLAPKYKLNEPVILSTMEAASAILDKPPAPVIAPPAGAAATPPDGADSDANDTEDSASD